MMPESFPWVDSADAMRFAKGIALTFMLARVWCEQIICSRWCSFTSSRSWQMNAEPTLELIGKVAAHARRVQFALVFSFNNGFLGVEVAMKI